MARTPISYRSSVLIREVAPTDVSVKPKNPLDFTDGATATFKVYDPAKDEVLSVAEAGAQTVLSVTSAAVFILGDLVEVTLDDGTIHDAGAVTAVDPTAGTITITTALASPAAAGRRVRVRLGTQIAMAAYGTPKVGTRDWGFQGLLPSNHPGLEIDLEINVEIIFLGTGVPAGGLDLLDVLCLVVKPKADCRVCS